MKIGLISERKVVFTFLLIQVYTVGLSQSAIIESNEKFNDMYTACMEKYGIDQQLANGVYFEDIYRTAIGHPYLKENDFVEGRVIYHNKSYAGLDLKFDIYEGQLLIKQNQAEFNLVTILTNDFLSSFYLNEMHFRKIAFPAMESSFYQVIKDEGKIQCYYRWYKVRKESIKDENSLIYTFSDDKRLTYLYMEGRLMRYNRNNSFWRLFPDYMELAVLHYLRNNSIKVKSATDQEMKALISYCEDLLLQRKMLAYE